MITENTRLGKDFKIPETLKNDFPELKELKNPGWYNMHHSTGFPANYSCIVMYDNAPKLVIPEKPDNVPFSEKLQNAEKELEAVCHNLIGIYDYERITEFAEIVLTADYDRFFANVFELRTVHKVNELFQKHLDKLFYHMGVFRRKAEIIS